METTIVGYIKGLYWDNIRIHNIYKSYYSTCRVAFEGLLATVLHETRNHTPACKLQPCTVLVLVGSVLNPKP